mgnify:CR=1 FL=1
MLLTLQLESDQPSFEIPVNYNHLVQAALYRNLRPEFASFLHNEGFKINNRRFALFVFSRLMGKSEYDPRAKTLRFYGPVNLGIASPIETFIQDTAQLLMKDGFKIGAHMLRVSALELQSIQVEQSEILVETLSPVVAYSTLLRPDGRKYTAYFSPNKRDFARIVAENAEKKARLIYGGNASFSPFQIDLVGTAQKHIVTYKNTIIEGYSGRFVIKGDKTLLLAVLEAGLGSKNSAGFGMIRRVE